MKNCFNGNCCIPPCVGPEVPTNSVMVPIQKDRGENGIEPRLGWNKNIGLNRPIGRGELNKRMFCFWILTNTCSHFAHIYIYGYKFVNKKPCQEIPNYSSTSFGPMAFQKWPIPRCGSQWIVFPLATHEKQGSWSCKTCGCRIGTQVPPFLSLGRRRCIQSTPWKTYGYCFGTLPRPKKKFHGVLLAFVLRQGGFLDYKL